MEMEMEMRAKSKSQRVRPGLGFGCRACPGWGRDGGSPHSALSPQSHSSAGGGGGREGPACPLSHASPKPHAYSLHCRYPLPPLAPRQRPFPPSDSRRAFWLNSLTLTLSYTALAKLNRFTPVLLPWCFTAPSVQGYSIIID